MKKLFVILTTSLSICGSTLFSAPYAAIVMNAKNGEVLHCEERDTKLHPAGLTKLLTLYIVFSKIENGEISLDEKVEVSRKASAELPAKLDMLPGQKIRVRYLIRATGIMGSNDTSTALAEHQIVRLRDGKSRRPVRTHACDRQTRAAWGGKLTGSRQTCARGRGAAACARRCGASADRRGSYQARAAR